MFLELSFASTDGGKGATASNASRSWRYDHEEKEEMSLDELISDFQQSASSRRSRLNQSKPSSNASSLLIASPPKYSKVKANAGRPRTVKPQSVKRKPTRSTANSAQLEDSSDDEAAVSPMPRIEHVLRNKPSLVVNAAVPVLLFQLDPSQQRRHNGDIYSSEILDEDSIDALIGKEIRDLNELISTGSRVKANSSARSPTTAEVWSTHFGKTSSKDHRSSLRLGVPKEKSRPSAPESPPPPPLQILKTMRKTRSLRKSESSERVSCTDQSTREGSPKRREQVGKLGGAAISTQGGNESTGMPKSGHYEVKRNAKSKRSKHECGSTVKKGRRWSKCWHFVAKFDWAQDNIKTDLITSTGQDGDEEPEDAVIDVEPAEREAPFEEVLQRQVLEKLDLTMLKLRHVLSISTKEAAEEMKTQQREQEKQERKHEQQQVEDERKQRELDDAETARRRVMGLTSIEDVEGWIDEGQSLQDRLWLNQSLNRLMASMEHRMGAENSGNPYFNKIASCSSDSEVEADSTYTSGAQSWRKIAFRPINRRQRSSRAEQHTIALRQFLLLHDDGEAHF
ncbi:hypothetical protein GQ600_4499 [Phytophthora cactorum]|nr:hypothetical protein GQ600_4499 [Phytophthora cactorum]